MLSLTKPLIWGKPPARWLGVSLCLVIGKLLCTSPLDHRPLRFLAKQGLEKVGWANEWTVKFIFLKSDSHAILEGRDCTRKGRGSDICWLPFVGLHVQFKIQSWQPMKKVVAPIKTLREETWLSCGHTAGKWPSMSLCRAPGSLFFSWIIFLQAEAGSLTLQVSLLRHVFHTCLFSHQSFLLPHSYPWAYPGHGP